MKLKKVEIFNFGPFANATIELDERGLLLIQGDNQVSPGLDSNGSGKSMMLESVPWCWFGKTLRDQAVDRVVNKKVGKDCLVRTTLDDDGKSIVIERGRKHSTLKNGVRIYVDGVDITPGTNADAEIVKQLGMDFDAFVRGVYFDGTQILPFAKLSDKKIKELIENALGIELFDQALEVVRAKKSGAKVAELDAVKGSELAMQRLNDARADSARRGAEQQQWDAEHATRLAAALAAAQAAPASDATEIARLIEEIGDHEVAADSRDRSAAKIVVPAAPARSTGFVQAQIAQIERDIAAAAAELQAVQQPGYVNGLVAKDAAIKALLARHQAIAKEVEGLTTSAASGSCKVCGQKLTSEEQIRAHIDGLQVEQTAMMTQMRQRAEAMLAENVQRQQQLTTRLGELRADDLTARSDLVLVRRAEEAVIEAQQSKHNHSILAAQGRAKAAALRTQLAQLQAADQTKQALARRLAEIHAEQNPHVAASQAAAERVSQAATASLEADKAMHAAKRKAKLVERLEALYGPKGLRVQVIDAATPLLNDRANHYVRRMADSEFAINLETFGTKANGDRTEKFTITVTAKNGGEAYSEMSAGERRRIDLPIALAFSDLVAARTTKSLRLWCADEIDEHLDTTGVARLVDVLKEIAARRGTAMVVSHRSMYDLIPNYLTVTKTTAGSTIEKTNLW